MMCASDQPLLHIQSPCYGLGWTQDQDAPRIGGDVGVTEATQKLGWPDGTKASLVRSRALVESKNPASRWTCSPTRSDLKQRLGVEAY